jgi:hypothetical protein
MNPYRTSDRTIVGPRWNVTFWKKLFVRVVRKFYTFRIKPKKCSVCEAIRLHRQLKQHELKLTESIDSLEKIETDILMLTPTEPVNLLE